MTNNGTIRVIEKEKLLYKGVSFTQITIEEILFWIKFKRTFRMIGDVVFSYNKKTGFYTKLNWIDSDVKYYFKLPVHDKV